MAYSEKAALKSLTGKIALITGAASGIGRAAALLFAREGAAVAITDVNQSGQAVAEEIIQSGGHAIFEPADVTQAIDCQRVADRTLREFGSIHVLFNNAGIMRRASVTELSEQDWDRVMAVNVKSIFLMSRHSNPHHGRRQAAAPSSIQLPAGVWLEGRAPRFIVPRKVRSFS